MTSNHEKYMDKYFKKAIGGIHLLPIFPSNGDRGFSPTRYDVVDPKFGTWQNVEKLGQQYYLMFLLLFSLFTSTGDKICITDIYY